MNRRELLLHATKAASILVGSNLVSTGLARATETPFGAFEKELLTITPAEIEAARALKEVEYHLLGYAVKRSRPVARTNKSDQKISSRADDLIVQFEVSSKATYEKKYQSPIYPGGSSGVTIGIGYDMGYVSREIFKSDWSKFMDKDTIQTLLPACRVTAKAADSIIDRFSEIKVPWAQAREQFSYLLPYYAGETHTAFPNCSKLSPDSFGALVSLVYNRGGLTKSKKNDKLERRREMGAIKALMAAENFGDVPAEIRKMKRIWEGTSVGSGLMKRRELEALLFEAGLKS